MKKIIFFNLPMKSMKNNEACYLNKGNVNCKCEAKVKFGLIAALYGRIKKEDDVLVILNETESKSKNCNEENIEFFKQEFESVLKIKLKEEENLKVVKSPFTETREQMQTLYRTLLSFIEEDCHIYADTTFGPRLNMPVCFSVFSFAERFYNAQVKFILNVKAIFDPETNKVIEGSQELYDIMPFYSLSNMTMAMKAKNGDQALRMLDDFFKL